VREQTQFLEAVCNDREMAAKLRVRRAEHERKLTNQPEEGSSEAE
jgi:hypothetical protein